jgi:hypothetical protein
MVLKKIMVPKEWKEAIISTRDPSDKKTTGL